MKKPAEESGGRHSHKFETRISAIADLARKSKQKKEALALSPLSPRRRPQALRPRDIETPQRIDHDAVVAPLGWSHG